MPERLLGLNLPTDARAGADPIGFAVLAEELGFDFVSSADHPVGAGASFETWTMLCFVAAATTRLRVATRVLGIPYRHPTLIAKMAETLDRLSGGRLILGLGGGSADEEQRAFGLEVRSPKKKTDGLEEAVSIIRGLWTEPRHTFDGSLYRTQAAELEPKPERPIPIWLGTFAPRALSVTGRLADGWIPSLGYVTADELVRLRGRVLAAAERAGRDPGSLTCALNLQVRVEEGRAAADDVVAGSPEEVRSRLLGFVEQGFTSFNFSPTGDDRETQVRRLAEEVVPALRVGPA